MRSQLTNRSQGEDSQLERCFDLLVRTLQDPLLLLPVCIDRDLITVLSDVMLYENIELVHESFLLLLQLFSQTKQLISSLLNVQLLEHEEEVQTLTVIREKLAILSLAAENAGWVGK